MRVANEAAIREHLSRVQSQAVQSSVGVVGGEADRWDVVDATSGAVIFAGMFRESNAREEADELNQGIGVLDGEFGPFEVRRAAS